MEKKKILLISMFTYQGNKKAQRESLVLALCSVIGSHYIAQDGFRLTGCPKIGPDQQEILLALPVGLQVSSVIQSK